MQSARLSTKCEGFLLSLLAPGWRFEQRERLSLAIKRCCELASPNNKTGWSRLNTPQEIGAPPWPRKPPGDRSVLRLRHEDTAQALLAPLRSGSRGMRLSRLVRKNPYDESSSEPCRTGLTSGRKEWRISLSHANNVIPFSYTHEEAKGAPCVVVSLAIV